MTIHHKPPRPDPLRLVWKRTPDRHRRAVRMLSLTLFLDEPRHWTMLSFVLLSRLTERERGMLAWAALRSLDPEPRELVCEMAHWGTHTCIVPSPFDTPEWRASCEAYHRDRLRGFRR